MPLLDIEMCVYHSNPLSTRGFIALRSRCLPIATNASTWSAVVCRSHNESAILSRLFRGVQTHLGLFLVHCSKFRYGKQGCVEIVIDFCFPFSPLISCFLNGSFTVCSCAYLEDLI